MAQATVAEGDGFVFRAEGDVTVAQGDVMSAVIVANGDATIDGEVTDTLWVINGDAIVTGGVSGGVVIIDGTLSLEQGSTVDNVVLYRASLDRADGASVNGEITEEGDLVSLGWGAALFSVAMWLGVTLALIVAVVFFTIYGGRQLGAIGDTLTGRVGRSILTALALWVGLPILAVLAVITLVGIPLGVGIMLVLLPALWFLGYLVTGATLGGWLMRVARAGERPERRWLAAAIGVFTLQVIGFIPALGPVIIVFAGIVGSGALIYWLVGHPREQRSPTAQPQPQPAS
jgi:hypothetical protein